MIDELSSGLEYFAGYTPAGYRRYKPYTLDMIMKKMKSQIKEGESFFYGAGSVRAKTAKRYRSLTELRKDKGQIKAGEEVEKIKKSNS